MKVLVIGGTGNTSRELLPRYKAEIMALSHLTANNAERHRPRCPLNSQQPAATR